MKRGWIAVAMIALSLLIAGSEYLYTTQNAQVYLTMLNDADEKMEQNETEDALSVAERLDTRFSKESKIYEIFTFHSDVLSISTDLAALRRYAQAGDTAQYLATSAQVKRKIIALSNNRVPRIENIL